MVAALFFFVMAHEAGHFIAAKLTKVKATEFFFGFGPRLFSFRRGETEYGVKAIPAGGYVRITGMNPFEEIDPADLGRTYREKAFWEKAFVVLAGVAVNFALAYLILWGMFVAYGNATGDVAPVASSITTEVDGQPSPAAVIGLQPGDELVELAGADIETWEQFQQLVRERPGETVDVSIRRDGTVVDLEATLATVTLEDGSVIGFMGVAPTPVIEDVGFFEGAGLAGVWTWELTKLSYEFLWNLVSGLGDLAGVFVGGEVADEARPVSVVGLARIGTQADALGMENILFLLAGINVILGAMNALPIFPLDGGHFAVALFEKVFRRQVDIRRLVPIAATVIVIFVFIGIVSIYLDIFNPFELN